jgi:hypothetical protein
MFDLVFYSVDRSSYSYQYTMGHTPDNTFFVVFPSRVTMFKYFYTSLFWYRSGGRFWPVDLWCVVVRRKSASLGLVIMRSDTSLGNNSEIHVIGSLLLVHYVLFPRAICLSLSLLFPFADEVSSLHTLTPMR